MQDLRRYYSPARPVVNPDYPGSRALGGTCAENHLRGNTGTRTAPVHITCRIAQDEGGDFLQDGSLDRVPPHGVRAERGYKGLCRPRGTSGDDVVEQRTASCFLCAPAVLFDSRARIRRGWRSRGHVWHTPPRCRADWESHGYSVAGSPLLHQPSGLPSTTHYLSPTTPPPLREQPPPNAPSLITLASSPRSPADSTLTPPLPHTTSGDAPLTGRCSSPRVSAALRALRHTASWRGFRLCREGARRTARDAPCTGDNQLSQRPLLAQSLYFSNAKDYRRNRL